MKKAREHLTLSTSWKPYALTQKSWDIVKSQLKSSLLYSALLYFLIPNSPSVYTIIMLCTFIIPMIKNMFDIKKTFSSVEHPGLELSTQKICYCMLNILFCIVGVWKFISQKLNRNRHHSFQACRRTQPTIIESGTNLISLCKHHLVLQYNIQLT